MRLKCSCLCLARRETDFVQYTFSHSNLCVGELDFHFSSFTRTLGEVTAAIEKQTEWNKYTECGSLPSAASEAALNTYLSVWKDESAQAMTESKSTVGEHEDAKTSAATKSNGYKGGKK